MVSAAVVPSKTDAVLELVNEGALLVGWVGVVEPPPPPPELALPSPPPPPPPQDPRRRKAHRKVNDRFKCEPVPVAME